MRRQDDGERDGARHDPLDRKERGEHGRRTVAHTAHRAARRGVVGRLTRGRLAIVHWDTGPRLPVPSRRAARRRPGGRARSSWHGRGRAGCSRATAARRTARSPGRRTAPRPESKPIGTAVITCFRLIDREPVEPARPGTSGSPGLRAPPGGVTPGSGTRYLLTIRPSARERGRAAISLAGQP